MVYLTMELRVPNFPKNLMERRVSLLIIMTMEEQAIANTNMKSVFGNCGSK